MTEKQKVVVDVKHVSNVFNKIMKVLQKKTESPLEALMVMKFGVAFFEISLGVDGSDDSDIRAFIKEMIKEKKSGIQENEKGVLSHE